MIRDLTLAHDAAGFPVVSWSEHRSAGSVAGPGTQKIECRIVKDASTGILLLCFRGRTRGRPFEFARPWERLAAFAFTSAVHRHESPAEHRQRELLVRKPHLKALWGDGGQALYADFAGSVTVDVSCPEISQVEQEQLHYLLEREFVSLRNDYVAARQLEGFRWPINNDQIETYNPDRQGWSSEAGVKSWHDLAATAIAAVVVFGGLALVFHLVGAW